MSETVTVRFGITSARELEIEVEQDQDVAKEFEEALSSGAQMLWIADAQGHRHGIVMGKVGFIEVEAALRRDVGFGSEA
ncbi:MAG: hypothetical protein BMS9Abin07_2236 [Acidimicrobiia bacterium]|nr:MAG: hypothetical protein BMS9Abin07_2236 [Acidimicrobiia bacterium]